MVDEITLMLQVLSDGEWHKLAELQQVTNLKENHIQKIATFLHDFDFATMDTENKKVRLRSYFQNFVSRFFQTLFFTQNRVNQREWALLKYSLYHKLN